MRFTKERSHFKNKNFHILIIICKRFILFVKYILKFAATIYTKFL
ncbi:hypothetical protein X975_14107, partial [Stegodyphus mimosarum]